MFNKKDMTFGEKLKFLRKKMDKSQTQVVGEIESMFPDKIRISQTALSALEQRDTAPREDVLDVLCKYYGVPITYFFENAELDDNRASEVKRYIEALRLYTPGSNQWFGHSWRKRDNNENSIDEDMNT